MKTKELIVPMEAIVEIAKMLEVAQISNTITGTRQDEEIVIEVEYDRNERQVIFDLEQIIENCYDEDDENEDDD